MSAFELVRCFGVRVVEVPDLDRPVIYVNTHSIALVRAGMDAVALAAASEWLMAQAFLWEICPGL